MAEFLVKSFKTLHLKNMHALFYVTGEYMICGYEIDNRVLVMCLTAGADIGLEPPRPWFGS